MSTALLETRPLPLPVTLLKQKGGTVESLVVPRLKVALASALHLPAGEYSLGKQALNWLSLFSLSASALE